MTICPDNLDEEDTRIYSNVSFTYESIWIGLLRVMHDARKGWKQVEVELSVSRDGLHWNRAGNREVFLPLGGSDSWDPDYTDPATSGPLRVDDQLWFYYDGSRLRARDGAPEDEWPIYQTAIGLAKLRTDGFASLNSGGEKGTVITRPLLFNGRQLVINADIGLNGWIRAGVVQEGVEGNLPASIHAGR